jgi:DNA-binding transcriptional LysR family regulator
MIELKQLRKFVVVAEQRNFTRAAELLHVAQPALSKQIARLEEQLDALLFHRDARPLQLTKAGRRLYDEAIILLERADRMQESVRKIAHDHRRVVTIGFSPTIVYGGISEIIKRIGLALPQFEVRWQEMLSAEQADALRKGTIDISFGRSDLVERDIVKVLTRDERLFVALPREDSLAQSTEPMSISMLHGQDLIVYPVGTTTDGFANKTLAMFRAAGIAPPQVHEVKEIDTALAFVAAGVGVCLIPATSRHLRPDIVYRLADPEATLPVFMCFRTQEDQGLVESMKLIVRNFLRDGHESLDPAYNVFYEV